MGVFTGEKNDVVLSRGMYVYNSFSRMVGYCGEILDIILNVHMSALWMPLRIKVVERKRGVFMIFLDRSPIRSVITKI